jgi:cellulose synthase/poly-beta-1,6-N-acetylglucosamine synthase-like glycosyltransferase
MISFIIPTKNEEKALRQTLEAIAQYRGPKEIIISDGNSTDATLPIAREYADTVLVHEGAMRQTIAQGRNAGAKAATGDYLLFLDADVIIPDIDTTCARFITLFQTDPHLTGLTVSCRVFPKSETTMDFIIFRVVQPFLLWLQNSVLRVGAAPGEFQMIPRALFESFGGFDETLTVAEDMELFWRLAKLGRTRCIADVVMYHSGRRAHTVGWPKLLTQWILNFLSVRFFHRSAAEEWSVIR